MSKRPERRLEMWDIFRHNETPPLPALSSKSSFSQNPHKASLESLAKEDVPKFLSKFEEQPHIEVRGRLRELEIQLLDIRAGLERRISSITEDFPNRLTKELRIIQERDSYLWKENTQKQAQLAEALKFTQEGLKKNAEQVGNELVYLRRKVDEIVLKNSATSREIEYISKIPRGPTEVFSQPDYSGLIQSFQEAIGEERKKREKMQNENNAQIQELHTLLRNFYTENGKRLQDHREQLMMNQYEAKDQLIQIETTKEEKIKNDQEYMKTVYTNLQKRVDEEVSQRIQLEKEYKAWTDGRLNNFQKMMKNEEKGLADREANILKMMQEGLSALHEIVTRVKEAGSAQVTKVHTVMSENIKDLAQALSTIKDNLYGKIEGLEFSLQEEGRYRSEQATSALGYIQNIVEDQEKYHIFIENELMSSENRLKSTIYDLQQEEVKKEEKLVLWKQTYEQRFDEEIATFKDFLNKEVRDWEIKHKDTKAHTEQTALKVQQVKEDFETSVEQMKNNMNFEDGLVEQKVQNSLNQINDKFDREVLQIKKYFERDLANNNAEQASNFLNKMEQMQKHLQEQVKSAISEEAKSRKTDTLTMENLIKHYTENIYSKVTQDLNREISEVSERLHRSVVEEGNFKGELMKIRAETANSIETLFSNIDEVKVKVKEWAENYTGNLIESTKEEFKLLIDIEREILLKEIDKARGELKGKVEDLGNNLSVSVNEEAQTGKKIEQDLIKEKEIRGKEIQNMGKRIEDVTDLMQETIRQSSEAVKAVCRALVTKEAAERNQAQESIMKSLQARIASLEDLLKFYSAKAAEELKSEVTTLIENERTSRNNSELATSKTLKKMKLMQEENKEKMQIEICLQGMIDQVVQGNTITMMAYQKSELEKSLQKWIGNFEKELEETNGKITKEVMDLSMLVEEKVKDLGDEVSRKGEVRAFMDSMIGLLEKHDTNAGIKEAHDNIEVLFRNMQKLEEFILATKEETDKNGALASERTKNEIQRELEKLDQRESENSEIVNGKVQFLIEKIEDIEKSSNANPLMEQLQNLKKEVSSNEKTINELSKKHEDLSEEYKNYTTDKAEKDKDLQESLKILAESNTEIENNLNSFQKELPEILKRVDEHEGKLKQIMDSE